MRKLFRVSTLTALALSLFALTAQAQRAKQFGIVAGAAFTDFSGCISDVDNDCWTSPGTTSKTGFVGGLFVGIPVGGGNTWIEPELLYIGKGAKYDNELYTGTETLDYISVPILFRWNSQPDGGFFVLIGPVVNFNITCNESGTYNPTGDDFDEKCGESDPNLDVTANTTIGGMAGLGYAKGRFGIEGRWMNDWGDAVSGTNPATDEEVDLDVRNTGWTLMLRFTK